ncbi:FeoB-associated Cys-rich membrane protein [Hominenteromicrobium mulieris]|uniref:FeoB-associated Cys-rich membrane protein n=1 Tax=Hominenteromicrobium mulieris TaxID=2885357 RepID=UPI003D506ED6
MNSQIQELSKPKGEIVMLTWLSQNIGTIIVLLVVVLIVAAIVKSMRRDKKNGKSSCGGNCAACRGGCMHAQK